MAPRSISLFLPHHQTFGYKALEAAPYSDDADTSPFPSPLANSLLCPRYAENDTESAPPSPASIESFDVLDSVAWRRGYHGFGHAGSSKAAQARTCDALRKRWRMNRAQVVALMAVLAMLLLGCVLGAVVAVRVEAREVVGACLKRGGAERCVEREWALCVARNGLGYCEGVL